MRTRLLYRDRDLRDASAAPLRFWPEHGWTLANYADVLRAGDIPRWITNSVIVSVIGRPERRPRTSSSIATGALRVSDRSEADVVTQAVQSRAVVSPRRYAASTRAGLLPRRPWKPVGNAEPAS